MNTTSDEAKPIILSDEERRWLRELPINLALQKIIKAHWKERCVTCGGFIGNHSLKKAKRCIREELKKEKADD